MRVCILQVLHTPQDKRVFHKIARSLIAAGHAVTSIVPSEEPLTTRDGVRFRTIPKAKGLHGRFLAAVRLIWEGAKVEADVYLAVEPETWVAALCLKAIGRGKVVFDQHEHVPSKFAKFFPEASRRAIEWLTVRTMRLLARMTDSIILTRESFEPVFHGVKTPRTIVLNTNHLQPPCTDAPEALRQRYSERPTLIHQGLFGDIRGSWQLLDAMKRIVQAFPDCRCILLGDYIYGDLEEYRRAIHGEGLDPAFDIMPWVPFDEVPAYIAVSRIGLILFQPGYMNHTLAMPHKLFDFMREGVPVIAPDFAVEVARIVRETDCGVLVDVSNPAAIAEAAIALLKDPAEAKRLGANGRRGVETKYNWANDEQSLLAAFAEL